MIKILVINPGSTSTKLAVYEDGSPIFQRTIRHSAEELSAFKSVTDQYAFRRTLIENLLKGEAIPLTFQAIIGRGGLLKPIPGGIYEVNEQMKFDLFHATMQHASNLGGLIASELASRIPDCKAFIADPVVVDELEDVSRISGLPQLPRYSVFHALNHKAVARKYARSIQRPYEELNLVVVHLGGGISVAAHKMGKVVDVNNALTGEGPFSPERAGTLPAGQLIDLCFSGTYSKEQLTKMINSQGGLMAHLGTTDVEAISKAAVGGDEKSALILHAMIYQVGKAIGGMCAALSGKADAIILTGGIANCTYFTKRLTEQIRFLAPVIIFPGEDEMGALASNAFDALRGDLLPNVYS